MKTMSMISTVWVNLRASARSLVSVPMMAAVTLWLAGCGHSGGTLMLTLTAPAASNSQAAGSGGDGAGGSSAGGTQGGGTGSGSGSGSSPSKSLFSIWSGTVPVNVSGQTENVPVQVDLTECAFGQTKTATVTPVFGSPCSCQLLVQGTPSSGNMTFSSCTSECSGLSGAATYTNTTALQVCQNNSCLNFN